MEYVDGKVDGNNIQSFFDAYQSQKALTQREIYEIPMALQVALIHYIGEVARKISIDALGKYFPNTPMLAAIVKISGVMTDEELLEDMKSSFKHKFAKKPEVIDGNMKALEMALKEVNIYEVLYKMRQRACGERKILQRLRCSC